jgi:hypothetical protein
LSQPYFANDPNKKKNYTHALGSFTNRLQSTSSSPATTVEEDEPPCELEKPHRTQALKGVAVEKAIDWGSAPGRPIPRSEPAIDCHSRRGRAEQIQSATIRHLYSQHRILAKERGQQVHHLPETTNHRPQTPVQISSTSTMMPE